MWNFIIIINTIIIILIAYKRKIRQEDGFLIKIRWNLCIFNQNQVESLYMWNFIIIIIIIIIISLLNFFPFCLSFRKRLVVFFRILFFHFLLSYGKSFIEYIVVSWRNYLKPKKKIKKKCVDPVFRSMCSYTMVKLVFLLVKILIFRKRFRVATYLFIYFFKRKTK